MGSCRMMQSNGQMPLSLPLLSLLRSHTNIQTQGYHHCELFAVCCTHTFWHGVWQKHLGIHLHDSLGITLFAQKTPPSWGTEQQVFWILKRARLYLVMATVSPTPQLIIWDWVISDVSHSWAFLCARLLKLEKWAAVQCSVSTIRTLKLGTLGKKTGLFYRHPLKKKQLIYWLTPPPPRPQDPPACMRAGPSKNIRI